ncbi:hypothetical protein K502DRAFT_340293 [Neoconidiobolus thromboides FSU 785]|nr:hypothetical protein K502DRAFT_340293 [Neoconidiobolus thromboides FSU 785]
MVFNTLSENEKEFLLKSVAKGKRSDGRGKYDVREIQIVYDKKVYGSVSIQLGKTKVLARTSCTVVTPRETRGSEGILKIFSELHPISNVKYELGKSSDEEIAISRFLEKTIKKSRALDLESLCIKAGEKVFEIRVDLHFNNHDGNLIDAGCLATLASLLHFRRPDVTVQGDEFTIHTAQEKALIPLTIHHFPVSVTFAFFNQGEQFVVDPTNIEEQIKDGTLSISMNLFQEICAFSKPGGTPLEPEQLIRCNQLTATISKQFIEKLKESHKEQIGA